MNRSFKDYAVPGVAPSRSLFPAATAASHHRRGNSLSQDSEVRALDLFSNNRRSISVASSSSDDRTASLKLGKISVGSAKPAKSGSDDLLTSADGGKHDYDWLLTPPETPLCPSAEGNEFQQSFTTPRSNSVARSISTTKSSRLSTNHVESNASTRPARSSSVTRSSISYSPHNNSYSSIKTSSNILNTSSSSVSSYIRSSSPITRSSFTSRPSTPSRTTPSRSSTPSKPRSSPTLSSIDKPRPSLASRPSTPNSRPQIASNSNPTSRSSTPTRRSTISSPSPKPNGGIQTSSVSRPSSPSPRIRQQQSVVVVSPDFSHDIPPNLRTSLPDRPVSVGRSRPSPAITAKENKESHGNGSFTRRASSPVVTRGRSVEPKGRSYSNGHISEIQEPRKSSIVPESPSRRNIRASAVSDSNGFGRSISKKSLDMAIKHMDIRNGPGNTRPLAGTVLYPQSIRSATSKIHASPQTRKNSASSDLNGRLSNNDDGFIHENGKYSNGALENGKREENGRVFGRLNVVDMFESSRYDAILLKEDLKNTNWLLSSDEKSDQGLIFDHGFESLPEPFGLS